MRWLITEYAGTRSLPLVITETEWKVNRINTRGMNAVTKIAHLRQKLWLAHQVPLLVPTSAGTLEFRRLVRGDRQPPDGARGGEIADQERDGQQQLAAA